MFYSPDGAHLAQLAKKPTLAFDETKDFAAQRDAIRKKFLELLGDMPKKVPLDPIVESVTEHETFTERRISFAVEAEVRAYCLLCIPKDGKKTHPLALSVMGHGTGIHVSMGRKLFPSDDPLHGDRDCAIQALERGYAALALEQRGFGDRRTDRADLNEDGSPRCFFTAMNALLVGRTLLGERCWDISRAIDLAETFPGIDCTKVLCTGNSGGGTATFYAACFDPRIGVAMPSCAVCTYRDSIGAMKHCACNYIPSAAKYFDMGDLTALIAPRKLVIINGVEDPIFPKDGVAETYETVKKIYAAAGAPQNCILTTGAEGHRYYKKEAWAAFEAIGGFEGQEGQ